MNWIGLCCAWAYRVSRRLFSDSCIVDILSTLHKYKHKYVSIGGKNQRQRQRKSRWAKWTCFTWNAVNDMLKKMKHSHCRRTTEPLKPLSMLVAAQCIGNKCALPLPSSLTHEALFNDDDVIELHNFVITHSFTICLLIHRLLLRFSTWLESEGWT